MSQARTHRREFLKTSASAAGALGAVPYFWSSAQAQKESKNDRLNVAAIGVGGRGTGVGHQAGARGNMVACADVLRTNAEKFAKRYDGRCQIYGDYRKILDRKDVDAVTCGTPDHWHAKIAIDAMLAGKDVYCEKPLTLTIEESALICKAVKQTGRVFQVGTQQRSEFGSMFLKAVAMARGGRLGAKLQATASVGGGTAGDPAKPFATADPPPELDWDFWLGQAPLVPYTPQRIGWNFRWWFDYSGGQVTDWGVHHTDIALWALGGEQTGAIEVEPVKAEFRVGRELLRDYLLGAKSVHDLPNTYNVAVAFECKMTLANGNVIVLNSGGNDLLIEGDRGRIAVNRRHLRGKPVEELTDAEKKRLDEEVVTLYRGKQPGDHMRNFFECIKDRSLPVSDVFTHAHSVNACHMANIAMLLGRKVRFDPAQGEFVGDAEANALIRRKQREPYAVAHVGGEGT